MQGSEKEGHSRKKGQPEQMQKQDLGSYPVSVFGGFGICLWAFKKKIIYFCLHWVFVAVWAFL